MIADMVPQGASWFCTYWYSGLNLGAVLQGADLFAGARFVAQI
jgi:hypothetical protein